MSEPLQGIFWTGDVDNHYIGHQFEEIFKSRIYAPYLESTKDAIVFDVGANVGVFSLYASKYAKHVYAFEPALEHFDTLNRMVAFNHLDNVTPIKKAIYINDGVLPFYHNKNRTMYSLHMGVEDGSQPKEHVETVRLDTFMKEQKIDHVNMLKLDIEGSEFEILGSESFRKVAPKIDVVIGETHQWANRHPHQIVEALKNNGFKFEPIQGDAQLFVGKRI